MKRWFLVFYLIIITSCQSQDKQSTKFADSINQKDLFKNLSVLASDSLQGREAGKNGQKKAARFIENKFKDFNLTPWISKNGEQVFVQKFIMHTKGVKKPFDLPMFLNKESDVDKNDLADYVETENVIGYIKGSEKENEYIIISAHYDHLGIQNDKIFNGADDNASGTSALLEIAEAFSIALKNNHHPKRSIIFAAFTAEEKGLIGSRFFVEYPTLELSNIVANLNIDMVGRNGEDFIYVVGASIVTPMLQEIIEDVNNKYVDLKLDYSLDDGVTPSSIYKRSDQYNFSRFGIPAVFFYCG